jgi:hypothetical protein
MSEPSSSECVQVAIRCRPPNKKEKENKNQRSGSQPFLQLDFTLLCLSIVVMDKKLSAVRVTNPGNASEEARSFTFDIVFGPE